MNDPIPFHPLAEVFPLIEGDDFAALVEDVRANGLKDDIWTHEGQIIDGRNRYRACREAGVEPRFRPWDGKGSLVAFVLSVNLRRRHLTASQRAVLAVTIEPYLAAEAKERQRAAASEGGKRSGETRRGKSQPRATTKVQAILPEPSDPAPQARDEAARLTGTSGRYVQDAKFVAEKAPELLKEVKAGTKTLPRAKREVKRQEKRADLKSKAKAAEDSRKGDQWRIVVGDCRAHLGISLDDQPRLIFADPPYNIGIDYGDGVKADRLSDEDYLQFTSEWVAGMHARLVEDGALWVLIGDEYAAELGCLLKDHEFTIRAWIKWYETFGVCNSTASNFSRCSRHLFYCVKDPKRFVWNADAVMRSSDRQTKYNDVRADPGGKVWDDVWQIPRLTGTSNERIPDFPTQLPLALLLPIIGCSSEPGDLILDPFSGSGTTGAAALSLGRRYLGIEKSEMFADLSRQRLTATEAECQSSLKAS